MKDEHGRFYDDGMIRFGSYHYLSFQEQRTRRDVLAQCGPFKGGSSSPLSSLLNE